MWQQKKALVKSALDLKRRSSEQAPIDTGDLRSNCAIDLTDLDRYRVYVGYSLPYALRQHEDLALRHTQGKAKFLEDPFNQNIDRYKEFIENEARKALSKWE